MLSFGCGCLHKSQFEVVVWFWFSRFIHGRMSAKLPITFWNSKGCLGNLLPSRTICLLYLAQKLKVAPPVQHPTVRLVPGWQDRGSLVGDPLRPGKKPAAVEPRSYGDLGDAQRQAKKAKKEVCFSSCWWVCAKTFATWANIVKTIVQLVPRNQFTLMQEQVKAELEKSKQQRTRRNRRNRRR